MAVINITIPFLLITWAEQSVDSSLAAILTSAGAALRDRPRAAVPPRRTDPGQWRRRPAGRVRRRGHHHQQRAVADEDSDLTGEIALLGAAFSYAVGAVYSRRNVRGIPPMIPAVFQVTFAAIITGAIALAARAAVGRPRRISRPSSRSCGWASSAPGWPTCGLPAVRELGRHAHDAGRLPDPGLGDHPRASSCSPNRSTAGSSSGRRW